ncbi:MAG: xylulokinase [Thermoprotei archaeon]|nr:MAG: xylulokinase [Thermoprotei archaeon]
MYFISQIKRRSGKIGEVLLGVDLGTTSVKVVAYTLDGRKVAESEKEYKTFHPRPDWAEQDPLEWIRALFTSMRKTLIEVRKKGLKIEGLCTTGQREGVVPLSERGTVLSKCIIWMDQRSTSESIYMTKVLGVREIYRLTGLRPSPNFTAAKLIWLKKHSPLVYGKTRVFLQPKEFLNYFLTGIICSDPSLASRTMLFDIRKLEWSEELAEVFGLSLEKMPEVRPSDDVIGYVKDDVARKLGLEKPVPVINGGGDRPCEALGGGVIVRGVAGESTGTATNVMMSVEEPFLDPKMRFLCSGHVLKNKWLLEGGTSPTGAILRWFRDNLAFPEVQEARKRGLNPYDIIVEEAERVAPGSEGLIMLPFFMGSKAIRWNPYLRGAFIGLTLGHTRAHIARSIMEGVAFLCKEIFEAYEDAGLYIKEVRLLGGAAKSILWAKIKSSVWEKRVLVLKEHDAAALGAAMLAGVGLNVFKDYEEAVKRMVAVNVVFKPITEWVTVYRKLYKKYIQYCNALEALLNRNKWFNQSFLQR